MELKDKLANFMETREYQALLERQVKAAKEFAGEEHIIIYMDPADQDKVQRLAMHHTTRRSRSASIPLTGGSGR